MAYDWTGTYARRDKSDGILLVSVAGLFFGMIIFALSFTLSPTNSVASPSNKTTINFDPSKWQLRQ